MKAAFSEDYLTLAHYLLGELNEKEQDAVEERYMLDEGYSQLRDEVETDLVDAYVNGMLTSAQRLDFKTNYLITQQRREAVQAAYLLKAYRDRVVRPAPARRKLPAFRLLVERRLAIAAGLGTAIAGGMFLLLLQRTDVTRPAVVPKQKPTVASSGQPDSGAPRAGSVSEPARPEVPAASKRRQEATQQLTSPSLGVEGPRESSPRSEKDVAQSAPRVSGGTANATTGTSLEQQGTRSSVADSDRAKLQNAGVSEKVIAAIVRPHASASSADPTRKQPASEAPVSPTLPRSPDTEPATVTTLPPPMTRVVPARKRRLLIRPFDDSVVRNQVPFWFGRDVNIGQGIRTILAARLLDAQDILPIEGPPDAVPGSSGAVITLLAEIEVFGKAPGGFGDGILARDQSGTAVVSITLRLVDAETGKVLRVAKARGESAGRKRTNLRVLQKEARSLGSQPLANPHFAQTVIGEATMEAVNKAIEVLEESVSLLSQPLEGHLIFYANSTYISLGSDDVVTVGEPFEIFQVKNEIIDATTKQVLDRELVKMGVFTVTSVHPKVSAGTYSGTALSPAYDKSYIARRLSR